MRKAKFTCIGMNNVDDPADVGAPTDSRELVYTEAVSLVNVDPDNRGGMTLRRGRTSALGATGLHSGWSDLRSPDGAYFVNGPLLTRVNADGSLTTVKYDLIPGRTVAFCKVNDVVVYSNGLQFGVIEGGFDTPSFVPTLQFKTRMVAGKMMEFYNGRLYALIDNYDGPNCALVCSDSLDTPGGVESMDVRQSVVAVYEGEGTMLIRVDTGFFVGTTKEAFYLGGKDAVLDGGFTEQRSVAPYAPILGTALPVKGEALKGRLEGNACIWASTRGVCVGGNGGTFENISAAKVSYPVGQTGTAVLREEGGLVHYVFALKGGGEAYNAFGAAP